jgi:hypothetical protein
VESPPPTNALNKTDEDDDVDKKQISVFIGAVADCRRWFFLVVVCRHLRFAKRIRHRPDDITHKRRNTNTIERKTKILQQKTTILERALAFLVIVKPSIIHCYIHCSFHCSLAKHNLHSNESLVATPRRRASRDSVCSAGPNIGERCVQYVGVCC